MKYKSTFEIKVSYFSDLHDDGLLVSGEFNILPIAIGDDDLKNKLYDLINNFLIKHMEKKKGVK